jgi:DNA ligase 1
MKAFSALIDGLVFSPRRSVKMRLLQGYFRKVPDPDRGYGLAALTNTLKFAHAKPALIRAVVADRVDPVLFAASYDFVGDLAETAALIWPARANEGAVPAISEVVERLGSVRKDEVVGAITDWLDRLDADGRYALLKLITGAMRVGVSTRLARAALADLGSVPVDAIEEVWHGLEPPYGSLFAWIEGRSGPPAIDNSLCFRPLMLANSISESDLMTFRPDDYAAEWKWDGIRIQLVARGGEARIYSRTGDDVSESFPDLTTHLDFDAVLDGELLVARNGEVASFNDLQQRLGRKRVSAAIQGQFPVHVRLYDILFEGGSDLRPLAFEERRRRLEAWYRRLRPERIDLSPIVPFDDWDHLARIREGTRAAGIEGLMIKRRDSVYVSGRPRGPWFKWKRDPLGVDCVLMYAQRGHGKRSSFYSDYTLGCWRDDDDGRQLVPVAKAYFGFTDAELLALDKWVRAHTVDRFGPVRAVAPELVIEIAFDSVHPSKRHKSGVAMRFPRIRRIRWDKPAEEADTLFGLTALIQTS